MIIENKDFKDSIINQASSIRESMLLIDKNKKGAIIIVGDNHQLLGTVSDGDIRRGILKGINLDEGVNNIMNSHPLYLKKPYSITEAERIFLERKITLIPIVNDNQEVISVLSYSTLSGSGTIENPVVLMVGGEGARLAPLTQHTPKPLLKVGDKPILQTILERLSSFGFKNVFLCTGYKAESIESFCGDGSQFNLNIKCYKEEQKLGTIGAVKFLQEHLTLPFLVMNGDLLTLLNYRHILNYHLENKSDLTVGSKEFTYSIPYGVLEISGIDIERIIEKPNYSYRVSAGIYVIDNNLLEYIPKGQYFDITNLMEKVKANKKRLTAFPIEEYWLDIGQHQDYKQANADFYNYFDNN